MYSWQSASWCCCKKTQWLNIIYRTWTGKSAKLWTSNRSIKILWSRAYIVIRRKLHREIHRFLEMIHQSIKIRKFCSLLCGRSSALSSQTILNLINSLTNVTFSWSAVVSSLHSWQITCLKLQSSVRWRGKSSLGTRAPQPECIHWTFAYEHFSMWTLSSETKE